MIYILILLSFGEGNTFSFEPQAKFLSMESCQTVAGQVAATDFVRCLPVAPQNGPPIEEAQI